MNSRNRACPIRRVSACRQLGSGCLRGPAIVDAAIIGTVLITVPAPARLAAVAVALSTGLTTLAKRNSLRS